MKLSDRIVTAETDAPLADAVVTTGRGMPNVTCVATDAEGRFVLDVHDDRSHRVSIEAVGYRPKTVMLHAGDGHLVHMEAA